MVTGVGESALPCTRSMNNFALAQGLVDNVGVVPELSPGFFFRIFLCVVALQFPP